MFNLRRMKHDKEIAFTFHAGYQTDYSALIISMSIYKYGLTIEWSK